MPCLLLFLLLENVHEELESCGGEYVHVGVAVAAAGLQCKRALRWPGHREAGVPGGIAIAVAGGSSRAALAHTPRRRAAAPLRACDEQCPRLGRPAHACK